MARRPPDRTEASPPGHAARPASSEALLDETTPRLPWAATLLLCAGLGLASACGAGSDAEHEDTPAPPPASVATPAAPSASSSPASPAPASAATTARPPALTLGMLFSHHVVLQRDRPIPIWGSARSGASVRVTLRGHAAEAIADARGAWRAVLDPLPAGGPDELVVTGEGGRTIVVRDVLVGEVWLCAGQSNMGMRLRKAADAERELRAADCPALRVFMVSKLLEAEPAADVRGHWQPSTPEGAAKASATAYFFGRALEAELGVPIGLIVSAVGGTRIEAWTSLEAQRAVTKIARLLDELDTFHAERARSYLEIMHTPGRLEEWQQSTLATWREEARRAERAGKPPPTLPTELVDPRLDKNQPAFLYRRMIAPLVGYALRGVIWYQGEHNTATFYEPGDVVLPRLYDLQLETLIASWRQSFGEPLPFYITQLTSWLEPSSDPVQDHGWPIVREQQALVAARVPGTGLAVTLDLGDRLDIHPKRKRGVGERLARLALARTYGRDVVDSGPRLAELRRDGLRIELEFTHADGLRTTDGASPACFALAGSDRVWHHPLARIEGKNVVLESDQVPEPVAVRYAWSIGPVVNLVNGEGLPAHPFRTDDWPLKPVPTPLPEGFMGEEDD